MPVGRPAAYGAVRISVCFLPHDDSGRSAVLWRSDTAHGTALVSAARYDEEAVACGHPSGLLPCDEHLRMDPERPEHQPLLEHADVLVTGELLRFEAALRRVDALLARHPGCLVAAVPGPGAGCVIGVRDALGSVRFLWPERGAGGAPASPGVVASVVHAWTAAGRAPDALRSVVPLPRP